MISKELLSEVLGQEVYKIREELEGEFDPCIRIEYEGGLLLLNIHELAHKCKEWARLKGYYLQSGFNIDIIEDNGLDIDYDYKIVDMFNTDVYKLFFDGKKSFTKMVGSFGDDKNSDFKACEWILKELKDD